MQSLFLVALAVDTLGHSNISRDPGVLQQSQDLLPSRSMAGMHGAEAQKMPLSWIEQCADLGESCLPTFAAGKLKFGCVSTTSATDLPRSSFTGVARKAWTICSACGPSISTAIPAICPLSLMLLAEIT